MLLYSILLREIIYEYAMKFWWKNPVRQICFVINYSFTIKIIQGVHADCFFNTRKQLNILSRVFQISLSFCRYINRIAHYHVLLPPCNKHIQAHTHMRARARASAQKLESDDVCARNFFYKIIRDAVRFTLPQYRSLSYGIVQAT